MYNPQSTIFSQRWILEEAMGLEGDSCLPSVMRNFPAPSTYLKIINYLEQIPQKNAIEPTVWQVWDMLGNSQWFTYAF